jgi:ethanolamine ammonia-lyase large subunit
MTNLPAHKRKNPPPAKTTQSNGNGNGIASTLIDGITFGAGSSIGHSIINKISGLFSSEDKCSKILDNFNECKKNYGNKDSWNNDDCMNIFLDYEKCKK